MRFTTATPKREALATWGRELAGILKSARPAVRPGSSIEKRSALIEEPTTPRTRESTGGSCHFARPRLLETITTCIERRRRPPNPYPD